MDLSFVLEEHAVQEKPSAISGFSGQLIVEHDAAEGEGPHWSGQVFAETGLDYENIMQQYWHSHGIA